MAEIRLSFNPCEFDRTGLKISSEADNALYMTPDGKIGINISDTPTSPNSNSAGNGIAGKGTATNLYRVHANVSRRTDIEEFVNTIFPPLGGDEP